jgi:hypothetical protein
MRVVTTQAAEAPEAAHYFFLVGVVEEDVGVEGLESTLTVRSHIAGSIPAAAAAVVAVAVAAGVPVIAEPVVAAAVPVAVGLLLLDTAGDFFVLRERERGRGR